MTMNPSTATARKTINRQGGFGRLRLMTVGGWLFMQRGGRKLEQKAGQTESSKLWFPSTGRTK